MTNALLFNKMRGSGREVTINLIDSGVEIVTVTGEPIAIWPYSTIDLFKESRVKGEGLFIVGHDQINMLQALDVSSWQAIISRAPRALRTERDATSVLRRMFFTHPDSTVWVIWFLLIFAIWTCASTLYHWLS